MNKVIALIAIVCSMAWLNHSLSSELHAVQSGELTLVCVMKDGERVIDGSKVTGLIGGKWTFYGGGYAGNCRIIEGGDL